MGKLSLSSICLRFPQFEPEFMLKYAFTLDLGRNGSEGKNSEAGKYA